MGILTNLKSLYKQDSIRSVAIYTFTNFFGKSASFLLLVIFTNPYYISPAENGLLSLFSNSLLLMMPFLSMGIIHSTNTEFFKSGQVEFKNLFTTGFIMPIAVMFLSCLFLFSFKKQLNVHFGFPAVFIWLIPFITFLIFCHDQLLNLLRNKYDTRLYLKVNLTKVILELGISLILVVFFAWHWQGRITGLFMAYVIITIYAFYYFHKNGYLFGRVDMKYIYSELVYAIPIIAFQVSTFCMGSSDRFFLSGFTYDNNETVGIYNVAATFGSIIIILCTAVLQYLFPKIYSELTQKQVNYTVIKKGFKIYAGVMLTGMLLIMFLIPVAYRFFINEKYYSGLKYVFILCSGYFLWTMSYFFFSFLFYYKEKKKILILSCCCIFFSLVFNYFFIKQWSTMGAALANICTYIIVLIITLFFTRPYWIHFFSTDNTAKFGNKLNEIL